MEAEEVTEQPEPEFTDEFENSEVEEMVNLIARNLDHNCQYHGVHKDRHNSQYYAGN